jgi:Ca2+-binding RTX toxin-like protein
MATRMITVDQLPGGNFVGGGNDTLFLSGVWLQTFDLSVATFSGYTKIITDAPFDIKMSNAQFGSISVFEGTTNNSITVIGNSVDLRGKSFKDVWGIRGDDGATYHADDINVIYRADAYRNKNDTFKFYGTLSEADRLEIHNKGFDIVIDDTGKVTVNHAPVIQNLDGPQQIVLPGQIVLLDSGSDAAISDDMGPIARIDIIVDGFSDYVRLKTDDRISIAKGEFYDFDLLFDGKVIGSYSKEGPYLGQYASFGFNDTATNEMVHYVLHRLEYVRNANTRSDKAVKIEVVDRGGLRTLANIVVKGVDGPEKDHSPVYKIIGGKGRDVLVGTSGKDQIDGLSGNDTPTGGAGTDVFVFGTALGKGTTKKNLNNNLNFHRLQAW